MPVDLPPVLHVPAGAAPDLAKLIGDTEHALQQLARILGTGSATQIVPPELHPPTLIPDNVLMPPAYAKKAANLVATVNDLQHMGEQTAAVVGAAGEYAGDAIGNIGTTVGKLNDHLRSVPITAIGNEAKIPPWAHAQILQDLEVALGDAHAAVTVTDNLVRVAAVMISRVLAQSLTP